MKRQTLRVQRRGIDSLVVTISKQELTAGLWIPWTQAELTFHNLLGLEDDGCDEIPRTHVTKPS